MFDRDRWQEIFSTLRANKLRTFLTGFGVAWGIFMLMIMLGSGNGLQNAAMDGFDDFATNSAFVWARRTTIPYKGFPRGRWWHFKNSDMEVLQDKVPEIDLLAPRLEPWGGGSDNNVVRGEETAAFSIKGDYPAFQYIDPINILEGRFINEIDIQEKRKVCVIGDRVKEVMFKKGEEPIGDYLKIKGVYFQVVGVFEPKNKNINFGGNKSETIHLPFTSLQQAWNFGDVVHWFAVTAQPNIPVSEVEKKCMKILADRNSIHPDDEQAFGHFNLEERFRQMTGLFFGIRFLIWIVGTGTLLAGVIGVSNIMLIIVKERTQEIGIQRALGATPGKIIGQIITESVFLTSVAGYIGMLFGIIVIELINFAMQNSGGEANMFKNPQVDFSVAMTALAILVIAGMFAGLIPARRAVSIKPIDAIRSE